MPRTNSKILRVTGALVVVGLASCTSASGPPAAARIELETLMSPSGDRVAQSKVQDQIAQCMKDRGWIYTPVVPPDGAGGHQPVAEMSSYGFVDRLERGDDRTLTRDPNLDVVALLGDAERAAYFNDLHGTDADPSAGCSAMAETAVYRGPSPMNNRQLLDRLSQLQADQVERISGSSELVAWVACMRATDNHYDFAATSGPLFYMKRMLAEAEGREVTPNPPTAEPDETWVDDHGVTWSVTGPPASLGSSYAASLREVESELFQADQRCRQESKLAELEQRSQGEIETAIANEFPQYLTASA